VASPAPEPTAGPRTYGGTGFDTLDYGVASDALEAAYPTTFAGLVNLQGGRVDVYVVDEPDDLATVARPALGPGPTMTVHQAPRTLADIRALKSRIDADAAELEAAGVRFTGAGIRIADGGPRVVVIYGPDTPSALDELEERYGADEILPIAGDEMVQEMPRDR
jgi:hypothetical protein